MKKLLTFFLTALLAFTVGWATDVTTDVTFEVANDGTGLLTQIIDKDNQTVSSGDVTLTFDKGTNSNNWPRYYANGLAVRMYSGNTLTVSCSSGKTISQILLTHSTQTNNGLSLANNQSGSYSYSNFLGTWTGSSSSVQFSNNASSGNARIYRVVVTVNDGGSTPVETCATPTFSPAAGTYTEAQDVTITTTTSGASIYYTTDNSTPSASNGTLYTGAIDVSETTTIKAIAVKTGNNDSQVAEATYTIEAGGSTIYRKVTSTDALTTGDYLIVYENGSVAFDGSLTTLDAVNNTQAVTITDNTITTSLPIYFTYNANATAHTLKSASGYYIGRTSNSNGFNASLTDPYENTITIDGSGNAVITSSAGPTLRYNSASNQTRFRYYASGQQAIQLYKKDSNNPTLLATPTTLALTDIPYDGSSTSGTFHLAGDQLTDDVTISVDGADFSVDPTSISPVSGTVNQDITVTYSGSSTTAVTATVTITCGALTETVTVTAKKATPPASSITITPATQTFNDNAAATVTIEGTFVNGNINASLATNTDWYMNPNTFSNAGGQTSVTYSGRALNASNTITAYAANNNSLSAQATVNYVADLYIVGDFGTGWNFNEGVHMTNSNGVYTAAITTQGAAYILFDRKLGEDNPWNSRFIFGPSSDGNWWLPTSGIGSGSIDLNDDDPIYIQNAGTYIVTINANAGTFTIEREVLNTGDFELVTDVNDLVTGYEVIIVNSGTAGDNEARAMSTTQNSNNRGSTNVAVSPTHKVSADDNVQIFALEGDNTGWYFRTVNGTQQGYIYAASSSSNYLRTEAERDENAKASIAIGSSPYAATITFQGTNSRNLLQYNTSNGGIFSCYANAQRDVFIYQREANHITVADPVISPESGRYPNDQEVTITCETTDATIYYTINGGEMQTYTEPFNVELNDNNTEATIVAWAVLEDYSSKLVTVTYSYKKESVNSIAEFNELEIGDEVEFNNPVVVLFDYSQSSNEGGQEYIWVKDNTGYAQFFIQSAFDAVEFVPKYENGDVIPSGFKVKRGYYQNGGYFQGQCFEWQDTFDDANSKALADPEQVTLSELLNSIPDATGEFSIYNDRYLYISKMQLSNIDGLNFRIATDEDGDGLAEVQGGTSIVGYNKYNSPAWKNKQGVEIGVKLPTDNNYYNVKLIFQKWQGGYEIMPIEFIPWQETTLRLEELVQVGVKDNEYTISNPLNAAKVTWDDNYEKFAIFAKDDEMYANKRYPNGLNEYSIDYHSQDGNIVNTVEQRDYDQSNWIEILIPSSVAHKTDQNYQTTLEQLQGRYENKILDGGTISGYYRNTLNPTIEMSAAPAAPTISSVYKPNIFCTANFLLENIDADGATSHRDNNQYFMMDGKPQEFAMVVWAYYPGNGDYFYAPMQVNDQVNGHNFNGIFKADMSLCEDILITHESAVMDCFDASNENGNSIDNVKMYGFNAIVRKNPAYWTPNANGAPRRVDVAPNTDGMETIPAYIVYPLNAGENANGTVTDVTEVNVEKKVVNVRYFNVMGMESEQPFDGINIIVTSYSDGSRSAIKVLK